METKRNEELQSRRDFFRNASKAVLPVLGAVVLLNFPNQTISASDCSGNSCTAQCKNSCEAYCAVSCKDGCKIYCKGCCANSCDSLCYAQSQGTTTVNNSILTDTIK